MINIIENIATPNLLAFIHNRLKNELTIKVIIQINGDKQQEYNAMVKGFSEMSFIINKNKIVTIIQILKVSNVILIGFIMN